MTCVFRPRLATTAIGSLPFADSHEAASFAIGAGLSIPFWPQIPRRSFLEGMIPQYSEGMPCVSMNREEERIWFDPGEKSSRLEEFYEEFLREDCSFFAISPDAAGGLYAFERLASGRTWPYVKGQSTGPVTFSTGVYSLNRETLYSDPDLRDAAVKMLVRKVEWQIGRLRQYASENVLIFVDEPSLAAYGSGAYVYLSEEKVQTLLREVFDAIAATGAISGIHICGNSDWGMIARSGVRIINFDAYRYGATMALYPDEIRRFLEGGGCIAWGIVPTDDTIRQENANSLTERLRSHLAALAAKGIPGELLRERALLTPSCGAGTMAADDARLVFRLLKDVRQNCLSQER